MTKTRELALLDKFISDLGPASYLGPWLADQHAEIVRDIQNDHEPSVPLPAKWRAFAEGILADARTQAEQIRADAQTQADDLVSRARVQANDQRRYVADAIAKHAAEAIARIGGRY